VGPGSPSLAGIRPQKTRRVTTPGFSGSKPLGSDHYNVLGLGAFLPLNHIEFDLLAFDQSLEAGTLDRAEVREYVGAVFLSDEAETFSFVEPFYGASCHDSVLYFKNITMPSAEGGKAW
jgi:hypothetical protein